MRSPALARLGDVEVYHYVGGKRAWRAKDQSLESGNLSEEQRATLSALVDTVLPPRVVEALGLEARPVFPRGYDIALTDFAILDPVRTLEPFYRKP